jgi:hypothetical protein
MATKKATASRSARAIPLTREALGLWLHQAAGEIARRAIADPQRHTFVARAIADALAPVPTLAAALAPMLHRRVAHHMEWAAVCA